mmetsp:Transcript_51249/g.101801  ORF Transcript_51249/g.101801 Transcript_51249/m.101801 type:complete len:502 (+) Transcript_51249:77-1582(+)
MAERTKLQLATGERQKLRLRWPDQAAGCSSRLGRLDWSVVVLDELTVDLEVFAELAPEGPESSPGLVLLQESFRNRTFTGSFEPTTDPRLHAVGNDISTIVERVEAVIFDFNNSFSWMTGKDVEIVALRVRPPAGPPKSTMPPLLSLRPCSPPPRGNTLAGSKPNHIGRSNGVRGAMGIDSVAPELRLELAKGRTSSPNGQHLLWFAGLLDAFLATAEDKCPDDAADCDWLTDVRLRIGALRDLCKDVPSALSAPPSAADNASNGVMESELSFQMLPRPPTPSEQPLTPLPATDVASASLKSAGAQDAQNDAAGSHLVEESGRVVWPPASTEPQVPAWKLEHQRQQKQQQQRQDANWWAQQLQLQQQEQREEEERQRQEQLQREMQQQQQLQNEAEPLERSASVTGLRALFEKNTAPLAPATTAPAPRAPTPTAASTAARGTAAMTTAATALADEPAATDTPATTRAEKLPTKVAEPVTSGGTTYHCLSPRSSGVELHDGP